MIMNRITILKGLLGLLFLWSVCPVMAGVSAPHPRYLTTPSGKETTWKEAADSLNSVLVSQFLNKEKGIFWESAQNAKNNSDVLYWQQAHYMDVLIYAYERLSGSTDSNKKRLAAEYENYFRLWLQNHAIYA